MYAVLHLRTTSGVTPFGDQFQYFQFRSRPPTAAYYALIFLSAVQAATAIDFTCCRSWMYSDLVGISS